MARLKKGDQGSLVKGRRGEGPDEIGGSGDVGGGPTHIGIEFSEPEPPAVCLSPETGQAEGRIDGAGTSRPMDSRIRAVAVAHELVGRVRLKRDGRGERDIAELADEGGGRPGWDRDRSDEGG